MAQQVKAAGGVGVQKRPGSSAAAPPAAPAVTGKKVLKRKTTDTGEMVAAKKTKNIPAGPSQELRRKAVQEAPVTQSPLRGSPTEGTRDQTFSPGQRASSQGEAFVVRVESGEEEEDAMGEALRRKQKGIRTLQIRICIYLEIEWMVLRRLNLFCVQAKSLLLPWFPELPRGGLL